MEKLQLVLFFSPVYVKVEIEGSKLPKGLSKMIDSKRNAFSNPSTANQIIKKRGNSCLSKGEDL